MSNLANARHCETMSEVRSHIDVLDDRITALLVERTGYMTQAARIKSALSSVRDQERIEFIVNRVRKMANELGGQPDVIEGAYRALMEASIAFEYREYVRLREGEAA